MAFRSHIHLKNSTHYRSAAPNWKIISCLKQDTTPTYLSYIWKISQGTQGYWMAATENSTCLAPRLIAQNRVRQLLRRQLYFVFFRSSRSATLGAAPKAPKFADSWVIFVQITERHTHPRYCSRHPRALRDHHLQADWPASERKLKTTYPTLDCSSYSILS